MRRVVAAEYVTVEGVMTDPGGVGEIEHGGWSNAYLSDELAKYQSDQLFASDALLLGRVTFDSAPFLIDQYQKEEDQWQREPIREHLSTWHLRPGPSTPGSRCSSANGSMRARP
jgi:hypothetical protein